MYRATNLPCKVKSSNFAISWESRSNTAEGNSAGEMSSHETVLHPKPPGSSPFTLREALLWHHRQCWKAVLSTYNGQAAAGLSSRGMLMTLQPVQLPSCCHSILSPAPNRSTAGLVRLFLSLGVLLLSCI